MATIDMSVIPEHATALSSFDGAAKAAQECLDMHKGAGWFSMNFVFENGKVHFFPAFGGEFDVQNFLEGVSMGGEALWLLKAREEKKWKKSN